MILRRTMALFAALLPLLEPGPRAQKGSGTDAPATLEELSKLARARAKDVLRAGSQELRQLLPDLSLSYQYQDNREFVDRAIQALARRGPDLLPLLLPYLDPESPQPKDLHLARNMARVLQEMGLDSLLEELIKLARTGKPTGRALAAELLGTAGRPEAIPALLASLEDPSSNVMAAAALALADLGATEARKPLLGMLDKKDQRVRDALLRAFAKLGQPDDLEPILRAFTGAKREETLLLLLHLIEELGQENQAALRLLGEMAGQEGLSLTLRQRAVEVMGRVGSSTDRDSLSILRSLLQANLTPEPLRRQVAFTLNDLGDSSGHRLLLTPADRFVNQNPKLPYAYSRRGDIFFQLGRYRDAVNNYNRAIALSRGSVGAEVSTWIDLFRCYALLGRYPDLLSAVRRSGLREDLLRSETQRHPELLKACEEDPALARALLGG